MTTQDILMLIKDKRKEKGIKQSDLADALEMTQSNYSLIEKGKLELTLPRLEILCAILGLDFLLVEKGYDREKLIERLDRVEKELDAIRKGL